MSNLCTFANSCQKPKKCQITNSCDIPKSCPVPKSCEEVNTCEVPKSCWVEETNCHLKTTAISYKDEDSTDKHGGGHRGEIYAVETTAEEDIGSNKRNKKSINVQSPTASVTEIVTSKGDVHINSVQSNDDIQPTATRNGNIIVIGTVVCLSIIVAIAVMAILIVRVRANRQGSSLNANESDMGYRALSF